VITTLWRGWRRRRLEAQASRWVTLILEDRASNADGLRQWVGTDAARGEAYNAAYRAAQDARHPSALLFGNYRERAEWVPLPSYRTSGWPLAARAAFSVALTLVGVGIGITALQHTDRGGPGANGPEYATRLGEVRTFQLPDGSHVILDTDSALRLDFSKSGRSVALLRGRARFQISHDNARPFVVSVGGATVTDTGTVFDIDASQKVSIHLISGAIDVTYPHSFWHPTSPTVRLSPGQQVRIDPLTIATPSAPTPADPSEAQWTSTQRTFDDVPVSQIVAEANRYSARKIELPDPAVGDRTLFLDIDIRDTRTVARELGTQLGLTLDESDPGRLLLRQASHPPSRS
jgi:transmembrane sensor